MSAALIWLATVATVIILFGYEIVRAVAQRRRPDRMARSAHAVLREEWFAAVSQHKGSEILAVQTLRNSLMSATMTASTAVLGLMGSVTLAASSLHASMGEAAALPSLTPMLVLELLLLALLFASLICSAMAVRYYNHAGFTNVCVRRTHLEIHLDAQDARVHFNSWWTRGHYRFQGCSWAPSAPA